MRVAIISKTFVATTAQRQLEWIARQPEIELTLITPPGWQSDDGRYLPFSEQFTEGYATRIVPVRFNGRYHVYTYRGLGRVLAQCQPDIIHIDEEPYNPAGAQAQRLADRLRVPSVFVAWQSLYRRYPPPFAQMEQYCYRHASHIVAGNHAVADVLRRKGYTGPLSVFSVHGVDPEIYRPLHTDDAAESDRFVIGYLGRLVLYKGLGVLLDALARLPGACTLRLVGSGPDEAQLRHMVEERGLAERVEFLPPVPTAQVPEVLTRMDVLALPSLTQPNWMEQFGRVLIEAMACEVPVVGSTSGEIPSVIGDAGLVVPEGDADALAAALSRLQDDPAERAALAKKGRKRVLSHFTQEHVARQLVKVYSETAAYRASGRNA